MQVGLGQNTDTHVHTHTHTHSLGSCSLVVFLPAQLLLHLGAASAQDPLCQPVYVSECVFVCVRVCVCDQERCGNAFCVVKGVIKRGVGRLYVVKGVIKRGMRFLGQRLLVARRTHTHTDTHTHTHTRTHTHTHGTEAQDVHLLILSSAHS